MQKCIEYDRSMHIEPAMLSAWQELGDFIWIQAGNIRFNWLDSSSLSSSSSLFSWSVLHSDFISQTASAHPSPSTDWYQISGPWQFIACRHSFLEPSLAIYSFSQSSRRSLKRGRAQPRPNALRIKPSRGPWFLKQGRRLWNIPGNPRDSKPPQM